MFETAAERVILLKSGLSEKEIERLYIQENGKFLSLEQVNDNKII